MRKNNLEIQAFSIKENSMVKGKFGWVNNYTGQWEVEPDYSYAEAIYFDFSTYLKELKKLKQVAIEKGFNSEWAIRETDSLYKESIKVIQIANNVDLIKNACEDYNEDYCCNKTNMECIKCQGRYFECYQTKERSDNE